jgi:hypothetical protein
MDVTNNGCHLLEKCQLILAPMQEMTSKHQSQVGAAATCDVVDLVRSLGYGIPYMGKDPFEEGWAISELPSASSFTSF